MDDIEKGFAEYMLRAGNTQGMKDNLLLELFAILYVEPKEVSLEELSEKTGYSLASISNKIKKMETMGFASMGLIKKTTKPGSKKIYLYMEKDFIELWKKMVFAKYEGVIKNAKAMLPDVIEKGKNKERYKKKIEIIQNYYDQMLKFEKVLKKVMNEFENI